MALYSCPGCGRDISTDANVCPHCGKGLMASKARASFKALPKTVQRLVLWAFGIAAGLLLLVAMVPEQPAPQNAAPGAQEARATASTPAPHGRMTVKPGNWFGFRERELQDRETRLVIQGDKEAWSKLMAQGMMAGVVTKFKEGEEVYVEDTAMLSGAVKIRRKGETIGWWTNFEAVKGN